MKSKNQYLYLIGAGLGYFFILKPILEKLGILKSSQEIMQENIIDKYTSDTIKKIQPSKPLGEFQIIADQINANLKYSELDDNKENATLLTKTGGFNQIHIGFALPYVFAQ